jgi:Fic family protein
MNVLKKLSKDLPFLKKIENLKIELDELRPLSKEIENKVFQKLRLDWNYNTNAIEGNVFTFGETIALLMEGITANGKPLKDALDIKGHNDAIDFMMDMIYDERDLNEADIRSLHKLILGSDYKKNAITIDGKPTKKLIIAGQYKTEPNHVKTTTGEIHYYATPQETPAKMEELIAWYNNAIKIDKVNPLVLASLFHHKFVSIHPFDDGNGRMTRILTNFILLKFGYPVSVIKQENKNKNEYYACLAQADNGELIPIIEYISNTVNHSLVIYFKAINGEDINEPDDIDKEIALFRGKFGVKSIIKKKKKDVSCTKIVYDVFFPLKKKLDNFTDIFNSNSYLLKTGVGSTFSFNNELSFDIFSKAVTKILTNPNSVSFIYNFNKDVHTNKTSININFLISFREKDYILMYKTHKLIRYYDEKIIDQQVFDLWRIIVKDVMSQIEAIKK